MTLKGQRYGWTQTPSEVTLTMKLEGALKAKDLDVVLNEKSLKVRRKNGPAGEYLIEGEFVKDHRLDDANWFVDDGVFTVEVTKIKRSEWWMSVLKDHKELAWSQIQPEHPTYVEDLDGETQATVKKMMFDNQQRQRGLPTRYVLPHFWDILPSTKPLMAEIRPYR